MNIHEMGQSPIGYIVMGAIGRVIHLGASATAAVAGTVVAATSSTVDAQTGGLAVGFSALVIAVLPMVSKELESRRAERATRRAEDRADRDRNLQGQLEVAQAKLRELEGRATVIEDRANVAEDRANVAAVQAVANTARNAGTEGKIDGIRAKLVQRGYLTGANETWPRLLLVEDDPETARLLTFLFTEQNFEVIHAATVADALDMLKLSPGWVVLDLLLGGEDGAEVLRKVRDSGMTARVIVTTGSSDPAKLAAVKALRPDTLLHKPIDYDKLIMAIKRDGPTPPTRPEDLG
jgi:ActR/RegA family two-component response regulator